MINSSETLKQVTTPFISNGGEAVNRDPFLDTLSKKYAGKYGDTINQVVNTIEALRSSNFEDRKLEVEQNLLTSIVEKINADVQGRFSYAAGWEGVPGQRAMYFNGRPAQEVYNNAVNDANGQIPAFEKARNMANAANLTALQELKNDGRKGFFVELSPSPLIDSAAEKRGYDGRDSIFVYDLGKEASIPVEQYWFKKTLPGEYSQLLDNVRSQNGTLIGPNQGVVINDELLRKFPDAVIMHNFIYVENKEELQPVLDFIKQRQNRTSTEAAILLAAETPEITKKVHELMPGLLITANSVLQNPDLQLDTVLEYLAEFIRGEQFALKKKLLTDTGLNTFNANLQQFIGTGAKSTDFEELRRQFVASGCGFAISGGREGGVGISFDVPLTGKVFDAPRKVPDAKDKVECPACHGIFYVKNGDPSTYYSKADGGCPHCHSTAVCC